MSPSRIAQIGRWCCCAGAALGAVGLLGWASGHASLTTFLSNQPAMKPNTALALLALGMGGAIRYGRGKLGAALASLAALVALAIGAGTLAEYALNLDLGIDELLPHSDVGPYPGRPSPPAALAISCAAFGLLLVDVQRGARTRIPEWLALATGLIGFTAALGQLFGSERLYRLATTSVSGVAIPTALALIALSAGLLLARPEQGMMRIATSPGPGGRLLRRLGLAVILTPAGLGLLVTGLFVRLGVQEPPLFLAVLAAAITAVSLLVLGTTAASLDRSHAALEASRARTQAFVDQASDGIFVADLSGRYTDCNDAACRISGYTREELRAKSIVDLIPAEDVERLERHREYLLSGQIDVSEWKLRRKNGTYLPVEVSAKILPDGRWQALVRDISERQRAREQLRQSEERLDLALRGADLATWDWSVQTDAVLLDARWAEMRGFHPSEVEPHVSSWTSGVHPDDMPGVLAALEEHFEGRTPEYETEHRVRTKSGGWIWILDRGKVFVRDEQGRPIRMVGTELDITRRKELEEELRRSEARASGILSISADAIVSIDEQQRITLFNAGAEKVFGYASAEVLGASLEILLPERLRSSHRSHVERFRLGATVARRMGEQQATISGRRKNGEIFCADAAISRLEVDGRQILTVSLRDVTEQKRLERGHRLLADVGALLASSLEYEETLCKLAALLARELADLCIIDIVEESGEVRRMCVHGRPQLATLCEQLARTRPERTGPHLPGAALESREAVLVQGPRAASSAWAAVDPEELSALELESALAVPILARGKALGAIGLVSGAARVYAPADVRLAEQVAEHTALSIENARLYRAARQAIATRDEVLGIVAHDLRNPLGAILMQVELLEHLIGGPVPDGSERRAAQTIQRAALRMNRLIQDLLEVTRIESGNLGIERTAASASELVHDAVDAQLPLASHASLELRLELRSELPELWVDAERLQQVFENLIGNAIAATPAGGAITVSAEALPGEVLFSVADTGQGVAPEDLPHLFDRFWQARRNRRQGTGLGLAIVKGLVEAHGGRVWVESKLDHGTTFFFTVPVASGAERKDSQ